MTDFDDLLGGGEPAEPDATTADRPKRGRPTNEERERRTQQLMRDAEFQRQVRLAGQGKAEFQPEDFFGLCSQNQIARLLHMDPATVKKRLTPCKPAGQVGAGRPVYYFHEAIPYLIKPKMDIASYLKTLNPTDMPNSINKTFWEAERIKNKVLVETGEAWHDRDVLEVLGKVFMLFKDRLPLITEGMRESGLTEKQTDLLGKLMLQLQGDLHTNLVDMPKERRTLARVAAIDPGDGPEAARFYGEDDDQSVGSALMA